MIRPRLLAVATFAIALAWRAIVVAAATGDRMSYIDNGTLRVGVNLDLGGSITFLAPSGKGENLVNNFDWGRQIQMSFYSGPSPFIVGDKRPKPEWKGLGWNPIQSGDCFGNRAKLLESTNDGTTIHVRSVPMQWPLNNVPGECEFESWISLERATVHVRSRIVNHRADHAQFDARDQELPAVYTKFPLHWFTAYTGDRPFTHGPLERLTLTDEARRQEPTFPWIRCHHVTENWAALVDDKGWGLGIWQPGCYHFLGGSVGTPGKNVPPDAPTGYVAPIQRETLDWNIGYTYDYVLILGSLDEIRSYVYDHAPKPAPPVYRFDHDRQHWCFHAAHDAGWPVTNGLNVTADKADGQLIGPDDFWQASDAKTVVIDAAFSGHQTEARLFWKRWDDTRFTQANSIAFKVTPDGKRRTYEVPLSDAPNYTGAMTGMRIDFASAAGDAIVVQSVALKK